MQKTKVVLIHNVISPHVTTLFRELSKKTNLTVLYCAVSEENRSWHKMPTGFKYKILPSVSLKIKGKDLFTYFINLSIFRELKSLKPKVVVISGWDLFAYQAAFLFCKLSKTKLVIWSGSTKNEKSWRRTLSLPLVKLMIYGADSFIAYGTRARDYLIGLGAKRRDIFIYNHATDVGNFPQKSSRSRQSNTILYYGQLIERKGIDILIEAYIKLRKTGTKVTLLIVGSGQMEMQLRHQINKLGIRDIKFIEDPGDEHMNKYFSIADVLVLPSREEVWGLVVNMALSNGIPAIVSDAAGSSADLIRDGINGYTFKNGSVGDLYFKLSKYFKETQKMRKIKLNSKASIKEFTPQKSSISMMRAINHSLNIYEMVDYYKTNRGYFTEMAARHNMFYYESVFRILSQTQISLNKTKMLDVGCGSGSFAKAIMQKYKNIDLHGTDLSGVSGAEKHLKFKQANAENLPFKDEDFDVVTFTDVLEHTLNPAIVLREATRVLRKNGYLILRLPNYSSPLINGYNIWNFIKDVYEYYTHRNKGIKNIARLIPDLTGNGGGDVDAVSGIKYGELLEELKMLHYKVLASETWAGGRSSSGTIRLLNNVPLLKIGGSTITLIAKKLN